MNLLSLIVIFLALVIVGSIAFIAWEITSERYMPHSNQRQPTESATPPGNDDNAAGAGERPDAGRR